MLCLVSTFSIAQKSDSTKIFGVKIIKNGSLYASWGYNEETYTNSNIYVVQPGMNNNYAFNNYVLRLASEYGELDVVKYLVE